MTSILEGFDQQKNQFFWGVLWFKFNNLRLAVGMDLKFYTSVAKGLKPLFTFAEGKGGKADNEGLFGPSSWIDLMLDTKFEDDP